MLKGKAALVLVPLTGSAREMGLALGAELSKPDGVVILNGFEDATMTISLN